MPEIEQHEDELVQQLVKANLVSEIELIDKKLAVLAKLKQQ